MSAQMTGWLNGALGMLIFSGSLPATRVAVADFSPLFLTSLRAVIAALAGALILAVVRPKIPRRGDLPSLIIVALCVVVGFPLLTALALMQVTAAHALVFIAVLPLCTAASGVLRGGERPRPVFWVFSVLGAALVGAFALSGGDGSANLAGDALMIAAVMLCGLGYAEGATLSRRLGGWQVISWALLLALPAMAALTVFNLPEAGFAPGAPAWAGLAYVSLFSMLIGFIFWYRGLALGGISTVGQLQLLQPFSASC